MKHYILTLLLLSTTILYANDSVEIDMHGGKHSSLGTMIHTQANTPTQSMKSLLAVENNTSTLPQSTPLKPSIHKEP